MWLRKGNLKRETESLLTAAQNNAIRTNYIKVRIDKMQQNSKCRLCGDRDDTINHIISECSKLAQKGNKTRHDWVGKVIYWKLGKKLKFDHMNKWCMHNLQFWDTNWSPNFGQITRPSNNQQGKENLQKCGLCCPDWPLHKIWKKAKRKISTKTLWENWKNYITWKWRWYQL